MEDRKAPKKIEVALTLRLPRFPKWRARLPRYSWHKHRKIIMTCIAVTAVVLTVGGGLYLWLARRNEPAASAVTSQALGRSTVVERPTYSTLLPEGKTIQDLGGWARVSPPDKDPAFAFRDSVGGVQLTVSEQTLPANFRSNPEGSVAALASDFNANQKITVGDIKLYVGTSAQGPQSVVFRKGELLILIRSTSKLTDQQWGEYAQHLR